MEACRGRSEEILRHEIDRLPYTVRNLRRGAIVTEVRVRGRRATAKVAEGRGPFVGSGHVSLRRVDGRWRLHNSNLIPYGD